jgi:hypothetical protein
MTQSQDSIRTYRSAMREPISAADRERSAAGSGWEQLHRHVCGWAFFWRQRGAAPSTQSLSCAAAINCYLGRAVGDLNYGFCATKRYPIGIASRVRDESPLTRGNERTARVNT